MSRKFGLIGYPLTHSFSKKYFTEKFEKESIANCSYDLYETIEAKEFRKLFENDPELVGINVTIPHKQTIIPYLKFNLDESAKFVGAVNVIKKEKDGSLKGYNSDFYGFKESLINVLPQDYSQLRALVLGNGGAGKAVIAVLESLDIPFILVSRSPDYEAEHEMLGYNELDEKVMTKHPLIINTTPLGMYPKVDTFPPIPYEYLTENHCLFDLVYNPAQTLFLLKGNEKGAKTQYGLEMLHLQAEKAWEIWNS